MGCGGSSSTISPREPLSRTTPPARSAAAIEPGVRIGVSASGRSGPSAIWPIRVAGARYWSVSSAIRWASTSGPSITHPQSEPSGARSMRSRRGSSMRNWVVPAKTGTLTREPAGTLSASPPTLAMRADPSTQSGIRIPRENPSAA